MVQIIDKIYYTLFVVFLAMDYVRWVLWQGIKSIFFTVDQRKSCEIKVTER